MDERVEVPMDKVAFLEFVGLVINTCIIPEDELEDRLRTGLDKVD